MKKNKKGFTLVMALVLLATISITMMAFIPLTNKNPLDINSIKTRSKKLNKKTEKLNLFWNKMIVAMKDVPHCKGNRSIGCFTFQNGINYCFDKKPIDYVSINTCDPNGDNARLYDNRCTSSTGCNSVGDGYWGSTYFNACGQNTYAGAKKACKDRGDGWDLPTRSQLNEICQYNKTLPEGEKVENRWYWESENSGSGYTMRTAMGDCSSNHTNKFNGISNYSDTLYGGKKIGDTYAICIQQKPEN